MSTIFSHFVCLPIMLATQTPQTVYQLQAEATPIHMIRTGDGGDKRNKEGMRTCIACSTEDTVACWLEWQAAPADAASSSPKEANSSEARSPLMLTLRVFGSRSSAQIGPFTFTMSCSSGTRKVGFVHIICSQARSGPCRDSPWSPRSSMQLSRKGKSICSYVLAPQEDTYYTAR